MFELTKQPVTVSRAGPIRKMFGVTMRYNLNTGIPGYYKLPVCTTRKSFVKSAFLELLWFLSGSTDSKQLVKMGTSIWEGNSSRSFLDSRDLTDLREGDIGKSYGFQWRHAGADYTGCDSDYTGQGIDQIKQLIEGIKNDPFSRRHILNTWNVPDIKEMSLPPCLLASAKSEDL